MLDLREAALGFRSCSPVLARVPGTRAGGSVCFAGGRQASHWSRGCPGDRSASGQAAPSPWLGNNWRELVGGVAAAAGEPGTPEPAPSLGGAERPRCSRVPRGPRCTPPPRSPVDGGSRGGPGMTRRRSAPASWLLLSLLGE